LKKAPAPERFDFQDTDHKEHPSPDKGGAEEVGPYKLKDKMEVLNHGISRIA